MKTQKAKKGKKIGHGFGSSVSISAVGVLLMLFLPWLVYQKGAGVAWIAIGAFVGVLLIWQLLSYRLMRFSLQQEGTITLPGFFSRRYHEKYSVIRILFSLIIASVFLLAAMALLKGMGDYGEILFGIRPEITKGILLLISLILLVTLGPERLRPVDRWISFLTLGALIAVNFAVFRYLSGEGVLKNIFHSWASGSVSVYVDVEYLSGERIGVSEHISMLSYGLLILGSPLVLQRLQQGENGKTVHTSRRWGIIFSLLSLFLAIFAGGMFRAALYPAQIDSPGEFIRQIAKEVPSSGIVFYTSCILFLVAGGLIFYDILHSCLQQATLILKNDLFGEVRRISSGTKKKKKNTELIRRDISRELSAVICCLIAGSGAFLAGDAIYRVLLETLIISACGLAPVTILSLYSGRMNLPGMIAGFFGGAAFAAFWELVPIFRTGESTLKELLGVHGTLPGMAFGFLVAWIVTLLTPKPAPDVVKDFEAVKYRYVTDEGA